MKSITMKKTVLSLLMSMMLVPLYAQNRKVLKKEVVGSVETQKDELIRMSDKIWAAAEVAFQEKVSSQTLIDYAKANGFEVEVGVA